MTNQRRSTPQQMARRDREILDLYFQQNATYREIQQQLNVSPTTIRRVVASVHLYEPKQPHSKEIVNAEL